MIANREHDAATKAVVITAVVVACDDEPGGEQAARVAAEVFEQMVPAIRRMADAKSQGDFTDLCRGPHVDNTKDLKVFKLLHASAAYWRGDERNPGLQRIYGTAWHDKKELKGYLHRLEEAKKRDHRKLGKELDLYSMSEEVGPGLILWHPKGARIRYLIE